MARNMSRVLQQHVLKYRVLYKISKKYRAYSWGHWQTPWTLKLSCHFEKSYMGRTGYGWWNFLSRESFAVLLKRAFWNAFMRLEKK